jgi:hypothetical protein
MLAFIILTVINIIILMKTNQVTTTSGGKGWTVFGTMGCGWTVRQLEYMKKNGKPHTFIDCDKEGCKGMTAFPTLKHPNGETTVGYKEV